MAGQKKPEISKIQIVNNEAEGRVYSNYVSVNTSNFECNLSFCFIEPLEVVPPIIKAKTVAKVSIPLNLVEPLIKALITNIEKTKNKK